MKLTIHTDGGARGNPGPSAVGVVIESPSSTLVEFGQYLGEGTNNQAEYKAVIAALTWIKTNLKQVTSLDFYLDSQLVVSQLTGKFKVKHPEMARLKYIIDMGLNELKVPNFFHYIPREKNSRADALVNQTLDSNRKKHAI